MKNEWNTTVQMRAYMNRDSLTTRATSFLLYSIQLLYSYNPPTRKWDQNAENFDFHPKISNLTTKKSQNNRKKSGKKGRIEDAPRLRREERRLSPDPWRRRRRRRDRAKGVSIAGDWDPNPRHEISRQNVGARREKRARKLPSREVGAREPVSRRLL